MGHIIMIIMMMMTRGGTHISRFSSILLHTYRNVCFLPLQHRTYNQFLHSSASTPLYQREWASFQMYVIHIHLYIRINHNSNEFYFFEKHMCNTTWIILSPVANMQELDSLKFGRLCIMLNAAKCKYKTTLPFGIWKIRR